MNFLQKIFSVKNDGNSCYKIMKVLGIKIKIKAKEQKIDLSKPVNNFGILSEMNKVVILANGPSLSDTLKDSAFWNFVKNKDVICVNSFPMTEYFFKVKPKYLVYMDPGYWCKQPITLEKKLIKDTIKNIKKADWNIYIILPNTAKEWNWFINVVEEKDNIKFIYLNISDSSKQGVGKFIDYKENIAMPSPQNVLVACIYCAINIGYKNIYIFGADHTWHLALVVGDDNSVCIQDKHFYDGKEKIEMTPMYKDPTGKDPFTMKQLMRAYMIVYEKYEILEEYSKFMGCQIYNMSKVSYIDAFERKKIGD